MSLPFDAALKEIIAPRPADFAPVFQFPPLQPARALNVDLSTISAATDVPSASAPRRRRSWT
jgi:hypothetical protein